MIKHTLALFLLLLGIQTAMAQKYDIGINAGATGYMGEINQRNPLYFTRGGFGLTVRKNFNPDFSLKFSLTQALLHADDQYSHVPEQIQRNLRFTSWVTEASTQFEFNFFKFNPFDNRMSYSPYLFAGVGVFHFNPYTFLDGQKVFLHGVGTEGQNLPASQQLPYYPKPYALNSVCIPVGMGFKYHLTGNFSMDISYGYRFTFTDYLDDIGGLYPQYTSGGNSTLLARLSNRSSYPYPAGSQRGDSWKYDKYFYASVGIIYTFRSIDCPKFYK